MPESSSQSTPEIPGLVLDRLIGEGGFGQVWKASNEKGDRVAIKILHFELISSHDALIRFQRELAAIERLQHPNVVRAIGHGTLADGRPYLLLEYLDGPSLREVIRDRGALAPEETLEILGPLSSALEVAHAAGLVHRDLKASNVVMARDATSVRPVLLDFGLVKLLDDLGPGLTSSRTMLGTPTAMAPEQMRGEAVDARTDVYALGLLVYHMLTGHPAFGAGGGAVKSYLQLHGPRPRPSAKIDIDPAIDKPVMRALAPAPDDRFKSVGDFYAAMKTVIQTTSTQPVWRQSDPTIVAPGSSPDLTIDSPAQDVVALYIEADRVSVARAKEVASNAGMTLAIAAPDSLLAVAVKDHVDVSKLKEDLEPLSASGRIALGRSRASIRDHQVDGPALDAESWAPFPLGVGLWIADDL